MKRIVVVGLIAGALLIPHAARAGTIGDMINAILSWASGGAPTHTVHTDDGPGTGTGIADD